MVDTNPVFSDQPRADGAPTYKDVTDDTPSDRPAFSLLDDAFRGCLAVVALVHMYQNRRQRGPLLATATDLGLIRKGDADTYNSGVKPQKDSPEEASYGRVNDLYAALASVPQWRD